MVGLYTVLMYSVLMYCEEMKHSGHPSSYGERAVANSLSY